MYLFLRSFSFRRRLPLRKLDLPPASFDKSSPGQNPSGPQLHDILYNVLKVRVPLSFPQLFEALQAESPKFFNRSSRSVKGVLRYFTKRNMVHRIKNPIPGSKNYLLHLGNGLVPADPRFCPNTEQLQRLNHLQNGVEKMQKDE